MNKKPRRHLKLTKQQRADRKMADMLARTLIPTLYKLLQAYPIGSRKHQTCIYVLRLMAHQWPHHEPAVPPVILELARRAKQ